MMQHFAIRVQEGKEKRGEVEILLKKDTEHFQNLLRYTSLQVQETEHILNRNKHKTPIIIIVKLWRTKDKKKIEKPLEGNNTLATVETSLNDHIFLIWNHESQKKVAYFSSAKRK